MYFFYHRVFKCMVSNFGKYSILTEFTSSVLTSGLHF